MLRRSSLSHMKPFLHAFSPGARASEKGMLYRNNNMNAHARVASIQNAQRTNRESKIFLMLLVPDQIFAGMLCCGACIAAVVVMARQQPFFMNSHKQRWIVGGMNEHEFYQRNDEMGRIFDMHREAIQNSRTEVERPAVLTPPSGYSSQSGTYA